MKNKKRIISVIGLGYVGLPVALAFSRKFSVIGFDINQERIRELRRGFDWTGQIKKSELRKPSLKYTADLSDLKAADFHIVTVPTPVDDQLRPDLKPIKKASHLVGAILKEGDVVVYESTVYPGLTEEICVPILERESHLKSGRDFKIGYSPERINPGDSHHSFVKIKKVVSGQDSAALAIIRSVYGSVVRAGIHSASSIKVAEAAKIIENTQRDLNIALVNELAVIFKKMKLDTAEVLAAAATKWNFHRFQPGLVGGHCIGVDPYYLTHKAKQLGYWPQVILSGRRINDGMGRYIARATLRELKKNGCPPNRSLVTILGLTFKENCSDIRNSKVFDIIAELEKHKVRFQVCDPVVRTQNPRLLNGVKLVPFNQLKPADGVVLAVAHRAFQNLKVPSIKRLFKPRNPILMDIKSVCDSVKLTEAGVRIWRL